MPKRADEVASFKPIQPERWALPNGLTVFFLPEDELPVVRARLFIRGGSLWAQDLPPGSVSAMGDLMRQAGAADLGPDALDKELEKLAASVGTAFGPEFGGASFSCLSADLPKVFELFTKVLLKPRFESDRISLWKGQALEGIRRRVEDPGTVASIMSTQLLYGSSAYGRVTTEGDINRISKADLIKLHKFLVRPDEAILVVTGKVEKSQIQELITHHLGGWEKRGEVLPAAPPVDFEPKPGIYFVSLPFSQATVQIGQLGVPRLTPDYPAIDVFNEVFGSSGFGSRLMKRVRTELGLSYGVYGGISPGVVRGTNVISVQTKAETVVEATQESIEVLKGVQSDPPTVEELAEKKAALRNSYVFNFDSADDIAGRIARLELLKYPADYDQTYLPKIEEVTPEQVVEVAKGRWNPEQFVVVVVGNESAYSRLEASMKKPDGPLAKFGLSKLSFDKSLVIR